MATKVGRPKAEIDLNMLEVLCRVQATQAEIAAELHVTVRTLQNAIKRDAKVREAYENGRLRGKASLRRMLIKRANAGSDACLIFALKNICGMSDRVQSEITGKDGGPLEVSAVDARSQIEERLARLAPRITDCSGETIDISVTDTAATQ